MGTIILVGDGGHPRSSCCTAVIRCEQDYTDTHVYEVTGATVEGEKVVAVEYTFIKTNDGVDGENWHVECQRCGDEIDEDGIDFEEG